MTLIDDPRELAALLEAEPSQAPPARSLLDVFEATLADGPGRLALDAPDARLSYAELWERAGALADELRAAGAGAGERVGVRVRSGSAELYVAILGVLRSGAAYVPADADDPLGRAEAIWASARVCAVVGDGLDVARRGDGGDAGGAASPQDDAWVIFTSGSTGAPKGVAVAHRAAAAFADAEARLWTVAPEDRVLAGLSVAFDASCEEIWLAWRNGAALVPAPRAVVRSGADLGPWLAEQEVTVVSTVPTLAAMWDEDVLAGVRLLILGGEACPPELGWRLAAGREVWNTYGPTEATVVSTATRIRPGEPVTIGFPLAGWETAVVDEGGAPVAPGVQGELAIAGVGLGRYLDPALDAERFAPLPALGWERAYRTGDLVRETPCGFEFGGRADDQVKLGGRRVELGEIEGQLRAVAGVATAAVAVKRSAAGNQVLVGYVVGEVEPSAVRRDVAERLPAALVPLVVRLDALPLRGSGKIDRAALPWPPPDAAATAALTGTAAWLAERWAEQLGPLPLAPDSDFFELGGTSVAVAKLVSGLRARFPSVAVADVYEHRRLRDLAARLDELGTPAGEQPERGRARAGRWGVAQVAGVLALLALTVPAWVLGIFAFNDLFGGGPQVPWPWLALGWVVLVSAPGRMLLAVGARRLLLPDLRPGRFPRRGWLATRVWFVDRLAEVLGVQRLAGTPWAPRVARLLGAAVGAEARLATLPSPTALIRIGEGATIEAGVDVHGWWIEGDELVVGELRVGPGARVGARSVLMPGADVGPDAEVEPGSVVSGRIPAQERWGGSPARRLGEAVGSWPSAPPRPSRHRRLWVAMYGAGIGGLGLLGIAAALPGLLLVDALGGFTSSVTGTATTLLASAPLLAAAFVIVEALLTALAFRAVSRLVRPGLQPDDGASAWALWLCGELTEGAQKALFPLYATVFTRTWLRLHGLRVGRRAEVSTAEGLNRFVTLGDTAFVADHPMFAGVESNRGWIRVEPIAVGPRTFVGNGAILAGATTIGSDCIVGIETNAPAHAADETSWFGAPALELPRMRDCAAIPSRTTDPPLRLVLARAATELVRILLPTSITIALGALVFLALDSVGAAAGALAEIAAAPFAVLAAALLAVLSTIAVKWLVIGRYRPGQSPLWSSLVWRDEIVNSCQEQLAGEWLMEKALGTPLLSLYLRAMGARVGRDVWCETLAVTEYDVVTLHDGAAVNRGACIETHLFHDRLFRVGPAELGAGATLGPVSAVLPDTRVGAGGVIGGRSVLMRGEELPAGTRWHGAPVVAA